MGAHHRASISSTTSARMEVSFGEDRWRHHHVCDWFAYRIKQKYIYRLSIYRVACIDFSFSKRASATLYIHMHVCMPGAGFQFNRFPLLELVRHCAERTPTKYQVGPSCAPPGSNRQGFFNETRMSYIFIWCFVYKNSVLCSFMYAQIQKWTNICVNYMYRSIHQASSKLARVTPVQLSSRLASRTCRIIYA
jgi:hypothetical protein